MAPEVTRGEMEENTSCAIVYALTPPNRSALGVCSSPRLGLYAADRSALGIFCSPQLGGLLTILCHRHPRYISYQA